MGQIRLLDTSEALPSGSSLSTCDYTPSYHPQSKLPLTTDSELTRAQKHNLRLRRKRSKRAELAKKVKRDRLVAETDLKVKKRLDREDALKVLREAEARGRGNGVQVKVLARPFKKAKRLPGHKDCGFGKKINNMLIGKKK